MDGPGILIFPSFRDKDVLLSVAQLPDIPFEVKRYFWLTSVERETIRGEHAHLTSKQLLIAIQGEISVRLEDTQGVMYNFDLHSENEALYIPPMHWGRLVFKEGSVGLAFASDLFNKEDYIRDYHDFKKLGDG